MDFKKQLYLGKSIKNKYKVLWRIKHGIGMWDYYLISISEGANQLDCTHYCYVRQGPIRNQLGQIVGIAKGYQEMLELVERMFMDSIQETGSANVKEYLRGRV